jgi:hypothetical protein
MTELAYRRIFTSCVKRAAPALVLILCFSSRVLSQSKLDTLLGKLDPQKFASTVAAKSIKLEDKLVAKSTKVLNNMQRQEEKIYKKLLHTKDSLQAKAKLAEIKDKYGALKTKLKNPLAGQSSSFIPNLDSLNTTLKFLNQNGIGGKVKDAIARTGNLKDKFQQADEIKKFIKERREQLKAQLEKLAPSTALRVTKQLKKINKQVYYYSAQVKEYKEILKDPKKIEKKALELLSKTKAWKKFFQKNSMLASLFRVQDPDQPLNMADLRGLQTRAQVNGLIQQQITAGGAGAQQQFQQNLQQAQSQLNELKNKVLRGGGSSSGADMPEGFKPNGQKTKSFLQRLELGTNMQSEKATSFFPVTTDLGVSLGYKLNDKSIIGLGASYKFGLGRGWNHIRFSHEGAGLRSFIDWKIKGSFWMSGGFEMNYRSHFNSFSQLQSFSNWQQSGLIGLCKSIPIKTKFFKKTSVRVLWDFLSYQQIPKTQPVIFRVGYNF